MDGWYALALSIIKKYPIDQAMRVIENGSPRKHGSELTADQLDDEIEQIIEMRSQGYTWQDIGDAFGMSKGAAYYRVKRRKK